jgi:hypothetical protein
MLKPAYNLVFFLSAISLSSPAQTLKISVSGQSISLSNQTEYDLKKCDQLGREIYVSNYLGIPESSLKLVQTKKMASFQRLFSDDTEPYSRKQFLRSRCLLQKNENSIQFLSGKDFAWADCSKAHESFKSEKKSVRVWISCKTTLWEITALDMNPEQISLACE